jgi:hypothetical protein
MTRSFYIKETRRPHLLRHMLPSELAGGHFYSDVFGDPEDLIDYINTHKPLEVIQQREKRFAFCFAEMVGHPVGTSGLAKRIDLQGSQIERHVREGYTLEVGIVDNLPETHLFCVIADETSNGFSIITAFPGDYARSFAQKGQPAKEYALNKQFWAEHVLLRKKS